MDEYQRLLRDREYTVLLADFSLLQLSFLIDRAATVKHRLCFYPCPISVDDEDLVATGSLTDYLDVMTTDELLERLRLDSPIRLEFDEAAADSDHPAAHLTISRDCCRIPVFGPLSVGHFARFIFLHFYPEWWANHGFLRSWRLEWQDRTITHEEEQRFHIEWRQALAQTSLNVL